MTRFSATVMTAFLLAAVMPAQRQMENIGRGIVAVRSSSTQFYVSWRLFATDSRSIAFNLYRSTGGGTPTKLNAAPLSQTTDFVDATANPAVSNSYFVRPVLHGAELTPGETFTVPANTPVQQYLQIPLQVPPPAPNACGETGTYSANDGSIADLDGDGQYEIVLKWDPSNSRDSASTGCSSSQILDAYKLDGTRLWRINLGLNVRAGAHYTQFMAYDLDGDGKAEVVMKTADGTVDGLGQIIGDGSRIWVDTVPASATYGKIVTGPEYLTVFDGPTGAALDTVTYVPGRDPLGGWGGYGGNCNNDSSANRADRFLAAVAYLDGVHPSVVMARGYYGRSVLAAWDFRNGHLASRWVFDTVDRSNPFSGQGNHNLSVGDVNADGKDEIVYGSMVVNNDGMGLFSTGLRHGDAMHLSRFDRNNPDLMVFGVHENESSSSDPRCSSAGEAFYNARTGAIVWSAAPRTDVGRGMAGVLDPSQTSAYFWGTGGLFDVAGSLVTSRMPRSTNFAAWWDSDLLRELEDGTSVTKYDVATDTTTTLLSASGVAANNGTKSTPVLLGDILGDWREEVVWRTSDNQFLRIYTTTIPAANRLPTLLQDPQYRLALAWQNVAYNQPPWPSFYLGPGMSFPPAPNIVTKPSAGVTLYSGVTERRAPNRLREWTVHVTNTGPGIAQQTQVNAVTLTQISGAACVPVVGAAPPVYPPAFPVQIGDLDQGEDGVGQIAIDFTGCPRRARFNVIVALSANGGPAAPLTGVYEMR